jgi:hypothetical protein|eukprot:30850-Pelagococcus_subviridis.AAC.13
MFPGVSRNRSSVEMERDDAGSARDDDDDDDDDDDETPFPPRVATTRAKALARRRTVAMAAVLAIARDHAGGESEIAAETERATWSACGSRSFPTKPKHLLLVTRPSPSSTYPTPHPALIARAILDARHLTSHPRDRAGST